MEGDYRRDGACAPDAPSTLVIAAGQTVLGVNLERSHSSHELPGIMVAFG